MIEELLPYYEKQLQEFGQQSRAFAEKYPKIAQRLALNQEQIDDPHIERLIQAFSFIAARIDKKLADSYDYGLYCQSSVQESEGCRVSYLVFRLQ